MRNLARRAWQTGLMLAMHIAIVGLANLHGTAHAAGADVTYPDRPVAMVVPFPPGGSPDQLARIVGQQLAVLWGKPVVVENRPGAGGNIAAAYVAKANPDGYTLLMGTDGPLAINPAVYEHMPYDPRHDFAPIGQAATVDFVLVAEPGLRARNVDALIRLARAQQPSLTYGSSGIGSQHHLGMEVFRTQAKVELKHVPYKGVSQALADVMGGHVSIMFAAVPAAVPLLKTQKIRAIAVTGLNRSPMLPDVPTISESGLGGFQLKAWFGLLAPARTPVELVTRINADLRKALAGPDVRALLEKNGFNIVQGTPDEFDRLIKSEQSRWAGIARTAGARLE